MKSIVPQLRESCALLWISVSDLQQIFNNMSVVKKEVGGQKMSGSN